jgi:ABC-type lipoprotein export system ATPase subunit
MTTGLDIGAEPLVVARDVARAFGTGEAAVVALHGATCRIHREEQIALTGPSGSGKSTLTHILAGLDTPTAGQVSWPAIGTREALRPGPVAVIFQGPSLLPPLDVAENVELPLLLAGVATRQARDAAMEALDHLDLTYLANKLPEELSGGQAQRVAVARALAGAPDLILADEPTGQLDRHNSDLVVDALISTAARLRAGLLLNTHDPVVSDRLPLRWQMHDGLLTIGPRGSHLDPGRPRHERRP